MGRRREIDQAAVTAVNPLAVTPAKAGVQKS